MFEKVINSNESANDSINTDFGKVRINSYILAVYIAFLPIAAGLSGIVGNISLLNYVALFYILIEIIRCLKKSKLVFITSIKFVYIYFFYTVFSCMWSRDFVFDWYFTTFLTTALVFTFATMNQFNVRELELLKKAFYASICVVFVVTLINIYTVSNYRLYVTVSSTIDPNDFACGLCVIFALLLSQLLKNKKKAIILPLIFLFLVVILSGSRGALLMVLGMLGYWLYIAIKNKKALTFFVLIVCLIFVFLVFEEHISQYLIDRYSISAVFNDGGSGRTKIWMAAFETFKNSNILRIMFGYGHGGFRHAVNYVAVGHSSAYEAHNMFINALIEGGILGLIFLTLAFIQVFKYAQKNNNTWGCLAVIGFFMEGLSLDAQSYRVFAVAFIVAVIYKEVYENASGRETASINNSTCL